VPVAERVVTACAVLALAVAGALLGVLGAFLVPDRVLGVPGVAVVVAVAGNLAVGGLAAYGLDSRWAAVAPALPWFVVVVVLGSTRPEGDLILPSAVDNDPAVGYVGTAFLIVGAVAAAAAIVLAPVPRRRI
jgi:hypothetical protein